MRLMYDAVNIKNIPNSATMIAAYVDGTLKGLPNYGIARALFPNAQLVGISSESNNMRSGIVLDLENSDWTFDTIVKGVLARRALGMDPTVYCNRYSWPFTRSAFYKANVPQPHYWIAWPNATSIPAGAIAVQYDYRGIYDVSMVADFWPGVDNPQKRKVKKMLFHDLKTLRNYFLADGILYWIPDGPDSQSLADRLDDPIPVTPDFLGQFKGYIR